MRHPSHAKVLYSITMGFVVVIYIAVGVFGYMVYGDHVEGSITLNLVGTTVITTM